MAHSQFLQRFTSVIEQIRNILRREGITGMDSMKHLTLYILARALDRDECRRLKISEEFAWECFVELANNDSSDVRQKCLNLLFNNGVNDLVSYLDDLFQTRHFNFKIRNVENHREIIKLLASVQNFKELHGSVDILGTVYEHHLGSGSNKSAMRDLGQFFTDRRICSYMVKLCKPVGFADKTAESVLDPTMGTGGFLTAFAKYLAESGVLVDWAKMRGNVAGFDIDEFVMSVGRINMYLSTGQLFDNIQHRDTLSQDIGSPPQRLKYRVILANMPFGVKGLKFANCCRRVKEQKCDGTKSEPLFLNLMMAALDEGGRCAVVVPDGVLLNNSKQHNLTRKYLLENFELHRVIKVKGQFFSNTGIQPSILFFENTGRPTEEIEFWDLEEDSSGEILESFVVKVPSSSLDDTYSLDSRKYTTSKSTAESTSAHSVKLGDLLEAIPGQSLTPEEQDANPGPYPVISGGRNPTKTYYKSNRDANTITVSKFGSYAGYVRWNDTPYWSLGSFTLKNKNPAICLDKYMYYYLSLNNQRLYEFQRRGPTTNFYWSDVVDLEIPLPSLSTQSEIISCLDNLFATAKQATLSAEAIQSQMKLIMQSVLLRRYPNEKLGDVLTDHVVKHPISAKDAKEGQYNLYSSSCDILKHDSYEFSKGEYLLQGSRGTISNATHFTKEPFSASNNVFVLSSKDESKVLLKFVYYFLTTTSVADSVSRTAVIPMLTKQVFQSIEIPIPPLEIQRQLVSMLSSMENEQRTLTGIAENAEERAKFILDGYLVSPPASPGENTVHMPESTSTDDLESTIQPKIVVKGKVKAKPKKSE